MASFLIHLVVLDSGTAVTIDEIEEKVHIVHAHQGRQAKILLELLGLDEFENEKVDIVEPVTYDEENIQDFEMINEDINNKNKDEGKTRSLLGVFPFNNFTNSDPNEEHNHHDQDQEHPNDHDQHNHEEEDPHYHHIHNEEHVHEYEETHNVGDPDPALRNPLSNRTEDVFPFTLGDKSNDNVQDTSSFSISQLTPDINSVGVSDGKGKQCVDKVNCPKKSGTIFQTAIYNSYKNGPKIKSKRTIGIYMKFSDKGLFTYDNSYSSTYLVKWSIKL